MRIKITAGAVSMTAALEDNRTARAIWDALPLEADAGTWGDGVYFGIPVKCHRENAREVVDVGDLAYWPPGSAFCIFFGPTPASQGEEPRAASPVNVFGRLEGDATEFRQVAHGARVRVEREQGATDYLANIVYEARSRTCELIADLSDEQLTVPCVSSVNPPLWELGHVAWFQEYWVLRHVRGRAPVLDHGDALYDSARVAHDTRWDLPVPSRASTLAYLREVRDRVVHGLAGTEADEREAYFNLLAVFHEDMHSEAFTYTRQALGYPAPSLAGIAQDGRDIGPAEPVLGDADVPGGTFHLGASPAQPFVFDNEKWVHPIVIEPFRMARAAVANAQYVGFVEDGGYRRQELWTPEGWDWRTSAGAERPIYWRRDPERGWMRRHFDQEVPLEPHAPVIHVCWHEADAYCRWAGRRLPTEAEWEAASAAEPENGGQGLGRHKRLYPWGGEPPGPERANLDWSAMGALDVGALPAGDSAFGCRQMLGNVWEWTSSNFLPYPGFVVDPYKEYSEPWFGSRKVLRGGCWATRSRLIRNTWRNFFTPDRRDVFAGFRTCAL